MSTLITGGYGSFGDIAHIILDGFEPVSVGSTVSVTITLVDPADSPRLGLTGLKWAFFDQVTPNLFAAPTAKGTGESTDGSGVLVVDVTGSALSSGQTGWLIVTDSDGTTTQSPVHNAFSGPVSVD